MADTLTDTITAEMIIHDVVTRHPETVKVFHGHGLPCTACAVGSRESIAGGARTHRFTPEKQALLVKDLNAAVKGEPTSVAPKKAPVGRGIPLSMAPAGKDGSIKQVIAIMSGKGGVGKSLVTGLLAVSLRRQGLRVGILDGDITGPSIARMFGTKGQPMKSASGGIDPLTSLGGIEVMSMNMFLEEESQPVVWRGPMVSSAIKQFYSDVDWGRLDYLLVDLPPGTSDAPMTVLQSLPVDGIVIVSSPQLLATMVVKKCINMVQQLKGIIVGVVENMAYFEAPNGERYEIFGSSNGPELVDMTNAPLLAQLPIDPGLTTLCDAGRVEEYHGAAYEMLAENFIKTLKIKR
ncbi:MAG TPA: P-loop NTPase [Ktedonobacteraceae bacterium]|nr:P-loop NTPase [Ktedonobacteraceae bacterium]